MALSSDAPNNVGNVPHLGKESSTNVAIKKAYKARGPQSIKVDPELSEKQSLKAKSSVKSRPSIASLVNENKGHIGKKVDITV